MTLRLYVLRHGEPEDRAVFYGHRDVRLSPRGHEQVAAQVRALADKQLCAVHSSDLARARIGAEAIAQDHGLAVAATPDLREMHLGELEGVAHAQAAARFPELAGRGYSDMLEYRMPGGGESVRDVAARVLPYLERVLGQHAPEPVVVYAHNTVARILVALAAGAGVENYIRFAQRFGAINRIDFAAGPGDLWSRATVAYANRRP